MESPPGAQPASGPQPLREGRAARAANGLLYALLLLLVWGLTAPLHGLWQDDTTQLSFAVRRHWNHLAEFLFPTGGPLRRLLQVPYFLAHATPHPVLTLQLLFGAVWLGEALAAGWIAGLVLPRRPLTRFLVVAMTLTATSDYLTDNLTALSYNFGALLLLVAAGCALAFLRRGGAAWLLGAGVALAASLWTIDVGIPSLPFLALLAALVAWQEGGARPRLRLLALLLLCGLVLAPVAIIEWRFLHDPQSYAAVARIPMSRRVIATRALALWADNFAPWRWALDRPVWYDRPPTVIPVAAMAAGAALAALAYALRVRRLPAEPAPSPRSRALSLTGLFALMALAANAAYANIHFSDIHYRTHILSRVWASLAVGIFAGWAAARWPRARLAALALPALFIGFGTWGGLERQDLFVSTWHLHQRELLSIATTVPAMRPGTGLILRGDPPTGAYLATQADYLTHAWLILILNLPDVHCLRLAPTRSTGCRPAPGGLDCWREGNAACFAAHTCAPEHFDYDRLILMDLDPRAGVYRLRTSLAGDPLAAGAAAAAAAAYHPEQLIVPRALSTAQRRLLLLDH